MLHTIQIYLLEQYCRRQAMYTYLHITYLFVLVNSRGETNVMKIFYRTEDLILTSSYTRNVDDNNGEELPSG